LPGLGTPADKLSPSTATNRDGNIWQTVNALDTARYWSAWTGQCRTISLRTARTPLVRFVGLVVEIEPMESEKMRESL